MSVSSWRALRPAASSSAAEIEGVGHQRVILAAGRLRRFEALAERDQRPQLAHTVQEHPGKRSAAAVVDELDHAQQLAAFDRQQRRDQHLAGPVAGTLVDPDQEVQFGDRRRSSASSYTSAMLTLWRVWATKPATLVASMRSLRSRNDVRPESTLETTRRGGPDQRQHGVAVQAGRLAPPDGGGPQRQQRRGRDRNRDQRARAENDARAQPACEGQTARDQRQRQPDVGQVAYRAIESPSALPVACRKP